MKANTKKTVFTIYMVFMAILVVTMLVLSLVTNEMVYLGVATAFSAFSNVLFLFYRRNNKD
ncbi:MAG: hypothetical protein J5685_02560 [Clostridiales bacterium]|nr:hypothetical protein [Clostridiales bacterium]